MGRAAPRFDASHVSGPDAIVTLRSFRRRFAEAFDQAEGADVLSERPQGTAWSPRERAAATATALAAIGVALKQVMVSENPAVQLPEADAAGPAPALPHGEGETPAATLAHLGEVARSVADLMAEIHGDAWTRTGQTPGGQVSALDIARLGVRIGVEHLRGAEQAIKAGHG
jgi:hypothetical protein